ncbi:carbon dioxide-concentrating protein CcmK [Leptolyngbya sp. 'hensonii']|uniref:carbon dioxide-concentrating mechanism protein CcmK n=1 Tax=Leptolyngbya sp. 'hensonii' TaxID=1922337 RepID=UPI00094F6064|nr:carbon dioxide-concentrating mechanism protein CcmK [Leptolyngbya sp. 'hensonii']OLP17845.1 carbon dioxide-concentrating protein CcmK [Leptolyngbya sp. 'hensonii']
MPVAVGMVEVLGHPPALSVADVMVKAARVTFVGYEVVSGARVTIIIRGNVSEVQRSVEAGVEAAKKVAPQSEKEKSLFLSATVIPRPHENVEVALPIHFRPAVEQFRF